MQADRGRVIGFFSERIQFELNPRYALGLGLQTSELAASLLALARRACTWSGKLLQRRLYGVTHFELNPLHSGAFKKSQIFCEAAYARFAKFRSAECHGPRFALQLDVNRNPDR